MSYIALNQVYVVLYALLGAAQGMGYTYLTSVLTTIERQFGIKSQEAAWIFSGNEIRQTNNHALTITRAQTTHPDK